MGFDFYSDAEIENFQHSGLCCNIPKPIKSNAIILECGCHSHEAIFETTSEDLWLNRRYNLDKVIVDTKQMNRPIVKIDFSALIYFAVEAINTTGRSYEVDLEFELERKCRGDCNWETLQTWRYINAWSTADIDVFTTEISEPFTVSYCDRACPDCCEYRMVVRARALEGFFAALRVVKSNMSALAQGMCPDR